MFSPTILIKSIGDNSKLREVLVIFIDAKTPDILQENTKDVKIGFWSKSHGTMSARNHRIFSKSREDLSSKVYMINL